MASLNRNYALFISQMLFLTAVGLGDNEELIPCVIIAFITHFTWMVTFLWTGISKSRVKVFIGLVTGPRKFRFMSACQLGKVLASSSK